MKIVVNEETKAYYASRLYKGGDVIENYMGKECPSWATEIIEPKAISHQPKRIEVPVSKSELIANENPTPPANDIETQCSDEDYYEIFSKLLDEAVSLDITYEPSLFLDEKGQIEELSNLIQLKKTGRKHNGFKN